MADSHITHNIVSAVNSLISGGITPFSLLIPRFLLSKHGKHYFINNSEEGKALNVLNFRRKARESKNNIGTANICN